MASTKTGKHSNLRKCVCYSELTDQQLKDSMLNPTSNIEKTIADLEEQYGRKLSIGVMPQGPLTIPYVEDED